MRNLLISQVFRLAVFASIVNISGALNLFSTIAPTKASIRNTINSIDESSDISIINQEEQIEKTIMNRRSLLMGLLAAGTASTLSTTTGGLSMIAQAEDVIAPAEVVNDVLESVYFGVGCFWHIQHEFVVAERELLGRSDRELTAFTGYAGGTAADSFGRVCYHNFQNVADYGKYGHGEVVGMKLPTNKIVDFAKVYFSLYNPKTLGKLFCFSIHHNLVVCLFLILLYFFQPLYLC